MQVVWPTDERRSESWPVSVGMVHRGVGKEKDQHRLGNERCWMLLYRECLSEATRGQRMQRILEIVSPGGRAWAFPR
jgi:hypothetical protein